MNTALSVLVTLNVDIKELSLSDVTAVQRNYGLEDDTFLGLASMITSLSENNLDRMITT